MPASPESGPRILFFSGGSALRATSRALVRSTHNSIHLVTPFDSGGSSARLRAAFAMPSVGDMRNRLLALADETVPGAAAIGALLSHRLDASAASSALAAELQELAYGSHALAREAPAAARENACAALRSFAARMPAGFDLREASIGNLVLTGVYLESGRDIASALAFFSALACVRGIVRGIVDDDLHLAAALADGSTVVGQHLLTGKGVAPISSRVAELTLVRGLDAPAPASVEIDAAMRTLITGADLIVFPMGSFFSSVIANLLPRGVGRAIAGARCPKIYVPSTGRDPEQIGMSVADAALRIVDAVHRDAGDGVSARDAVSAVLVDRSARAYAQPLDLDPVRARGIEVVEAPLAGSGSGADIEPRALARRLVDFCSTGGDATAPRE